MKTFINKMIGRINLTLLLILFLLTIVIGMGYVLYKGVPEVSLTNKSALSTEQYPRLKTLVEPEVAKVPDAPWVTILANNEMDVAYAKEDDTYFVTIYDESKEIEVKAGVVKYFEALGVTDVDTLKVEYRVKPTL